MPDSNVVRFGIVIEGHGEVDALPFVMLDADDDCPAELGPSLTSRALPFVKDRCVTVVIPKHEFESWFLAAARSLAGKRGLREDVEPPEHPEEIRGAKEWLSKNMVSGTSYSPTVDQAAPTAAMDLTAARTCQSFERFVREIRRLIESNRA